MRDYSELKTKLETRLGELDARIHTIEDRLDDPKSKDWEAQAIEHERDGNDPRRTWPA